MHDMAEHVSSILSLVSALATVIGVMIWKKLNGIEDKVDQYSVLHFRCREELPLKFATKEELKDHKHEFKDWQNSRRELWEALNGHSHDNNGKVIR
jgi:hypothetical protein